jgi:hypothetical protein
VGLSNRPRCIVGGEVLLRHDPSQLPTAEWATSNAIVQAAAGNQTQKQVPLLEGTYFIAFRDQSGVRSVTPVAISAVLPTPQPRLVVKTWVEDPGFAGKGENLNIEIPTALMLLENSDGYPSSTLLLENGDTFIEESLNAYTGLFMNPAVALTGEYLYEEELDLGQVYDVNIRRRVISGAVTFGTLFDDVPGLFDDQPGDFDGDDLDQVNAVTYVSVANDEISDNILLEDGDDLLLEDGFLLLAEAWGPWNEYANAIVRARGIRLKVEGVTRTAQVGLVISELGATAELQQRTETASSSGSSTYNVTYADAFYAAPDVTISPSNMATGDFFTLTSITRTGFTVAFSNSASAAVTRSFTYTAVGYGREI